VMLAVANRAPQLISAFCIDARLAPASTQMPHIQFTGALLRHPALACTLRQIYRSAETNRQRTAPGWNAQTGRFRPRPSPSSASDAAFARMFVRGLMNALAKARKHRQYGPRPVAFALADFLAAQQFGDSL
jgi:hypothetical protein